MLDMLKSVLNENVGLLDSMQFHLYAQKILPFFNRILYQPVQVKKNYRTSFVVESTADRTVNTF